MMVAKHSQFNTLNFEQMEWVVQTFALRNKFFIETVELPLELGDVLVGIHGPSVGEPPVLDSEVEYVRRPKRKWKSRMFRGSRPQQRTRTLTVIGGPTSISPCSLYTVYGGPPAPQEPADPKCVNLVASRAFWSVHALVG